MEIDMVQLMILSVLVEQKATSPGMGMTLNEIVEEVNKSAEALTERCPRCLGQGKISWVTKGYHWEKVTIAKIVIHVTSGKSQKKYTIVRSDDTRTVVDEPGICETEEKAQERCEILEEKERKSLEIKKAELKRKMENKRARKQQQ